MCTLSSQSDLGKLLSLRLQAVLNGYDNKFNRADKHLRFAVMCNCFAVAEFVVLLMIILLVVAVYLLNNFSIISLIWMQAIYLFIVLFKSTKLNHNASVGTKPSPLMCITFLFLLLFWKEAVNTNYMTKATIYSMHERKHAVIQQCSCGSLTETMPFGCIFLYDLLLPDDVCIYNLLPQ